MSEPFLDEISAQFIESWDWTDQESGTIWAIRFLTEKRLNEASGKIQRELISEAIRKATEFESFILTYLWLENPLDENGSKVSFFVEYPLTREKISIQSELYQTLYQLYSLRNPHEILPLGERIGQDEVIRVWFWPDKTQKKMTIRRIEIIKKKPIDTEADHDEQNTWNALS